MEYPVIIKNFIDLDDIKSVIEYIDNLQKEGRLEHKILEHGLDGRNLIWNPDDPQAIKVIKKYTKKIINAHQNEINVFPHVCGFYKYEKNSGMGPHSDIMSEDCNRCILSAVLYFNNDYVGGEIFFPSINKEFRMDSGSVIIYPAHLPEFDHGVKKITSGVRYSIPMCFTTELDRSPKYYN